MLKDLMTFIITVLVFPLLILSFSCGGDKGIEEPLNEPFAPVGDTTGEITTLYGNYFLLDTDCPNDGSALRVAQSEAAIQIQDGFAFADDSVPMVGFVDEDSQLRFFADADGNDVNCTANADGSEIVGVCSYEQSGLFDTCRFVYAKEFSGIYSFVWNDCESDGSPLELIRNKNQVTLLGGFDYQEGTADEEYYGIVQSGKILFNLDALQPEIFMVDAPGEAPDFNCDAVVSKEVLTGACNDLTKSPSTQCTFGYEASDRLANVDLNDDARFPSPAITPSVSPTNVTNMEGIYAVSSNACENDGGSIEVYQEGTSLGFVGGFDYQAPDPDMYAGTIDTTGTLRFSVLGPDEKAFCTANLVLDAQGIGGFTGNCTVQGDTESVCSFTYNKTQ